MMRCVRLITVVLLFGVIQQHIHSVEITKQEKHQIQMVASHQARSLQPGEVVLLAVTTSVPAATVSATVFRNEVWFYQSDDKNVWRGLLGIDLTTDPGDYSIALRATTTNGMAINSHYTLTVLPKEFPTRKLTVAPKYVSPPVDVLERIKLESQKVSRIFDSSLQQKLWNGPFVRPVPGKATSSFGSRSILNGLPRSPHRGTDFRASEGTPIAAPNGGKVVLSEDLYYSGNCVILDHGWGLFSHFAHLSRLLVGEGDTVIPGQVIGDVGSTGRVTGPHLHWSMRLNGARVDPLSLMAVLLLEPLALEKSDQ